MEEGSRGEWAKQSARNETKPPPTAAAATAATAASQNLNDKRARTNGQRGWRELEGGQWNGGTERQTNTDGNFLHTNSVTDKQRERGKVSERGRRREQQQQKIQLNIEITNPQLSCAL